VGTRFQAGSENRNQGNHPSRLSLMAVTVPRKRVGDEGKLPVRQEI